MADLPLDPVQAEAIKSVDAGWLQWSNYAVQPQVMQRMVMRRMIGLGIYRLDINLRESAVVGMVGGGGIGATLLPPSAATNSTLLPQSCWS